MMEEIIGIIGVSYLIVMGLMWYAERYNGESQCTHDCDQGRRCTCGKKEPNENP